jgi:histidinol-phosphatase (PHP family)
MLKVDGHTHTHYCPHGSGDHVEEMIIRAIELGFEEYHVTEHAPLPGGFLKSLVVDADVNTFAMNENDLDDYIKELISLKNKYQDKIDLKIGFEIDFLEDFQDYTRTLLNEYGKWCDTGIISVHFLKGLNGWRSVDYSSEDTKTGLVSYYGGQKHFQLEYFRVVEELIVADLGSYKPNRIGHLTLCNKFKKSLGIERTTDLGIILHLISEKNYTMDLNVGGLFLEDCDETYPPLDIIKEAKKLGIPLIYGSDAHAVKAVGRGYEKVKLL